MQMGWVRQNSPHFIPLKIKAYSMLTNQLLLPPDTHIIAEGCHTLLTQNERTGDYTFVDLLLSGAYDLSSKTYVLGMRRGLKSGIHSIEEIREYEVNGFYLNGGDFLAIFDDYLSFKHLVKDNTYTIATPSRLITRSVHDARWNTVLEVFPSKYLNAEMAD
jgi:hypothetical protein